MGTLIFIDTSAVVAILTGESEADRLLDVLALRVETFTAPQVRLVSTIILARNLGLAQADRARQRTSRERHRPFPPRTYRESEDPLPQLGS